MGRLILLVGALLMSVSLASVAKAEDGLGFVSEIRAGLFAHDIGIVSNRKEEPDVAGVGEVLFVRPSWRFENRFVNFFLTPRPHVGGYVAAGDGTSFGYAGVTWDVSLFGPFFAEFGFGGVIHNGNLDKSSPTQKALGTRVLFHEQLSLGVELTENIRALATISHISNANASKFNSGMDMAGVKIGYKF